MAVIRNEQISSCDCHLRHTRLQSCRLSDQSGPADVPYPRDFPINALTYGDAPIRPFLRGGRLEVVQGLEWTCLSDDVALANVEIEWSLCDGSNYRHAANLRQRVNAIEPFDGDLTFCVKDGNLIVYIRRNEADGLSLGEPIFKAMPGVECANR